MHHDSTALPALRGRPREFDPRHVTRRAMDIFWSKGYNGTTLPDLVEATRLSRSSLYAAYGDKHGLFLAALDQFIQDSLARIDSDLDASRPALECLRACLAGCVQRSCGTSGKRGCLVVRIRRFFDGFEQKLTATLVRARESNALADGVDPSQAARILLSVMEGLRVLGKTGIDEQAWLRTVDALIDSFRK
jgi:TetR/AcrR family transcriptional regulator, transcriptional repressor for nem operon